MWRDVPDLFRQVVTGREAVVRSAAPSLHVRDVIDHAVDRDVSRVAVPAVVFSEFFELQRQRCILGRCFHALAARQAGVLRAAAGQRTQRNNDENTQANLIMDITCHDLLLFGRMGHSKIFLFFYAGLFQ